MMKGVDEDDEFCWNSRF